MLCYLFMAYSMEVHTLARNCTPDRHYASMLAFLRCNLGT